MPFGVSHSHRTWQLCLQGRGLCSDAHTDAQMDSAPTKLGDVLPITPFQAQTHSLSSHKHQYECIVMGSPLPQPGKQRYQGQCISSIGNRGHLEVAETLSGQAVPPFPACASMQSSSLTSLSSVKTHFHRTACIAFSSRTPKGLGHLKAAHKTNTAHENNYHRPIRNLPQVFATPLPPRPRPSRLRIVR